MSIEKFKLQLNTQFAKVGKAVSNPHRLTLLDLLSQGERTVESLANAAAMPIANASHHLQQLRQAGLVIARKEGLYVYYRLSDISVIDFLNSLHNIAEKNLAEVEKLVNAYLTVKDDLEPVTAEELLRRMQDGTVTVLDVRPPKEFAAGHLAGAINIPVEELAISTLARVPSDRDVVAYCRGPYCVFAYEAVTKLRKLGYRARRLRDGYPQWKSAGLPVDEEPSHTNG